MAMTVRFATGLAVTYNDAHYCAYRANGNELRTAENGSWIATVPKDAIIEVVKPCSVSGGSIPTVEEALDVLLVAPKRLAWNEANKMADLKRKLRDFNITKKRWK